MIGLTTLSKLARTRPHGNSKLKFFHVFTCEFRFTFATKNGHNWQLFFLVFFVTKLFFGHFFIYWKSFLGNVFLASLKREMNQRRENFFIFWKVFSYETFCKCIWERNHEMCKILVPTTYVSKFHLIKTKLEKRMFLICEREGGQWGFIWI